MSHRSRKALEILVRVVTALLAIVLLLAGCGDDPVPPGAERVTVRAEFASAVDGFAVEATAPAEAEDGVLAHEVRVTWQGDGDVVLDDARFTQQVPSGDGLLVTAGRGCGAQWDAERDEITQACTDDLQIIPLAPGETHAYPVRVHVEIGPHRLEPGVSTLDEPVRWWVADGDPTNVLGTEPSGTLLVRLTYEVN